MQAIKTKQKKSKKFLSHFFGMWWRILPRYKHSLPFYVGVRNTIRRVCLQGSIKLEKDGKITFEEVLRSLIWND